MMGSFVKQPDFRSTNARFLSNKYRDMLMFPKVLLLDICACFTSLSLKTEMKFRKNTTGRN